MTVFERMSKINALLAPAALGMGATAWFHPSVAGSDLWWHLAAGREMWSRTSLIATDPFSHTFADKPWTNHEWLWELLYWPAYSVHPDLVACLNFAVLVCVFGLSGWAAYRLSRSPLAAAGAVWLAAAASHWFLDIRPHLFSLLLVGVVLVTRERRWAPFLWPPLFLVWVNLHGGFVFGLGLVGLHVLFRTVERTRAAGRLDLPRAEWLGLMGAGLAILVNPYGLWVLEYPLAYLDAESPFRSIREWHAPGLSYDPRNFEGRFFWLAAIAVLGALRGVRRSPYLVALGAVTLAMAVTSRRFIPLFAVTSAPMTALGLGLLADAVRRVAPGLRATWQPTLLTSLLVAGAFWQLSEIRFFPRPLHRWTQSELYPAGAVRFLAAIDRPPERLFNLYNWGGYLMLHAPGIRVFMDGRANTLYDERIFRDYRVLSAGKSGAPKLLARYDTDAVLMPSSSALTLVLVKDPAWKTAHSDAISTLLLRRNASSRLPAVPGAHEGPAEFWLERAARAMRRGRQEEARQALERAVAADPLLSPAYQMLLMMAARRQDADAVRRWSREAIEVYPRERSRLMGLTGRAFERLGDLEGALVAAQASVPRGPFRSRGPALARIRRLESLIGRRRASPAGPGEGR
ncbi:MAG: hypothetical protein V3T14_13300 [Myxococcota bacterium]